MESKGVWTLISYLNSIPFAYLNHAPYEALDGLIVIGFEKPKLEQYVHRKLQGRGCGMNVVGVR